MRLSYDLEQIELKYSVDTYSVLSIEITELWDINGCASEDIRSETNFQKG
jgi:hypothetical protein